MVTGTTYHGVEIDGENTPIRTNQRMLYNVYLNTPIDNGMMCLNDFAYDEFLLRPSFTKKIHGIRLVGGSCIPMNCTVKSMDLVGWVHNNTEPYPPCELNLVLNAQIVTGQNPAVSSISYETGGTNPEIERLYYTSALELRAHGVKQLDITPYIDVWILSYKDVQKGIIEFGLLPPIDTSIPESFRKTFLNVSEWDRILLSLEARDIGVENTDYKIVTVTGYTQEKPEGSKFPNFYIVVDSDVSAYTYYRLLEADVTNDLQIDFARELEIVLKEGTNNTLLASCAKQMALVGKKILVLNRKPGVNVASKIDITVDVNPPSAYTYVDKNTTTPITSLDLDDLLAGNISGIFFQISKENLQIERRYIETGT